MKEETSDFGKKHPEIMQIEEKTSVDFGFQE
jgi:hypothetical protein